MIVTPINYDDLIVGDKNAIMIAARVLGYGDEYTFTYNEEEHTISLSQIEPKPLDEPLFTPGRNEFDFNLPLSKTKITFKILTHKDEQNISRELEGLKKLNRDNSPELSTRLKYIITSINGDDDPKTIREFVDKHLLARDGRAPAGHRARGRPHLQDELPVAHRRPRGKRRRRDDRRAARAAGRCTGVWDDGGRRLRPRSQVSREGRRSAGDPWRSGDVPGIDGHLLLLVALPSRTAQVRRE